MPTKKSSSRSKPVINPPDAPFAPMFPVDMDPGVDIDAPSDTVTSEMVEKLAGAVRGNKPDISALPDALAADGRPLFRVGDKIIIEQYAIILEANPYLHTRTYKVDAINPKTGDLRLWDDTLCQWGMDNYLVGPRYGQVYKLAAGNSVGKRKRGRPRKNPVAPVVEAAPSDQPVEKKRRGRPKGSKNRPRAVVAEERKAIMEARAERRAKRRSKA